MRLKRRTLALFAGPGFPLQALGLPAVVYLPPYYAGELGMGLAAVGLIFFLVRAIDLPLDPLIGALMDRTRSRWGRFRPWLAMGGLLLGLGFWLTFFAKPGLPAWLALIFLLVVYGGQSTVWLAQTAWGARLTPDYDERSRLFGWWQAANVFALLLIAILPTVTGGTMADKIHMMGWWALAMIPLTILPAVLWLPEPPEREEAHHASLRDVFDLRHDRLMMRLLAADLLVSLAPGVTGALFRYFFERVLLYDSRQTGLLLLVYFATGLATVPFWSMLARRLSKHRALAIAGVAYAVLQTATMMLPPGHFGIAAVGMVIAGIPYAAGPFLLRSILADVADADRLRNGADRTGLLYAILTTTGKFGYAIPVGATFWLLSAVGFDPAPGAANSAVALDALIAMYIGLPATIMLCMAWLMWRWPHDAVEHARVQSALAARDASRAAG